MRVFGFDLLPYPEHLDHLKEGGELPYPLPKRHFRPDLAVQNYREHLDAWVRMEELGFDGIGFNEHHTSPYGLMTSPNLMAAAVSQRTQRMKLLIYGNLLPIHDPLRLAEELAMLDCLSNGRLISGFARGIPREYVAYGVDLAESRARFEEAWEIIKLAWTEEAFSYKGKFWSYKDVAIWPRPVQQPHPPVWVPGSGSISTFDFAVDNGACYCFLSYSGAKAAKSMMDKYWQVVTGKGKEPNPYRAGFLQLVAVGETDAAAEQKYARHVEYFYHKCMHWPLAFGAPPGNMDFRSLQAAALNPVRRVEDVKTLRYRDFVEKGYVIAGSPATVRDRLKEEVVKSLRVGNLMVLLQIGSMPHELTLENMDLFARKVLPELRSTWDDEGWVNEWWPEKLRGSKTPATAAPVAAGGA